MRRRVVDLREARDGTERTVQEAECAGKGSGSGGSDLEKA
jgi:hypothetical protein